MAIAAEMLRSILVRHALLSVLIKMDALGIRAYLENIRDQRTGLYNVNGLVVTIDGMHYAGKSSQIGSLLETYKMVRIPPIMHHFRETSLEKSEARVAAISNNDEEQVLNQFIQDRVLAWQRCLIPFLQQQIPATAVLDRSSYSTLAAQMLTGNFNSWTKIYGLVQKLFAEPILPSHVAIFLECSPEIAYERRKKSDRQKKEFSPEQEREVFLKISEIVPNSIVINTDEYDLEDFPRLHRVLQKNFPKI